MQQCSSRSSEKASRGRLVSFDIRAAVRAVSRQIEAENRLNTLDGFEICVEPPLPPPVSPHSDKSHSGVGQTQCVRIATCRQELYAVYRHYSTLDACPHTWGWLEISLIIDLNSASPTQMFIFSLHKWSFKYGHCCVHANPLCFRFFFICQWAEVDWWLMRCIGVTKNIIIITHCFRRHIVLNR